MSSGDKETLDMAPRGRPHAVASMGGDGIRSCIFPCGAVPVILKGLFVRF